MTIEHILSELNLNEVDIFNVYQYGSRVYGTHNNDSDWDYIIVANQDEEKIDAITNKSGTIHATLYSIRGFIRAMRDHDISVIECYFLPKRFKLKEDVSFTLNLDSSSLRHSISEKASHSWCKAKKKFLVEADYNYVVARKSFFHAIRILIFGIQLAKDGHLYDYQKANYIWFDILATEADWNILKAKYQDKKNALLTEFRKLVPK